MPGWFQNRIRRCCREGNQISYKYWFICVYKYTWIILNISIWFALILSKHILTQHTFSFVSVTHDHSPHHHRFCTRLQSYPKLFIFSRLHHKIFKHNICFRMIRIWSTDQIHSPCVHLKTNKQDNILKILRNKKVTKGVWTWTHRFENLIWIK